MTETIVIVSDLHLGATDAADAAPVDAAFVDLLEDIAVAVRDGGRRRLLLLGDTIDFLAMDDRRRRERGGPPDTGTVTALANLDRVAAEHPDVFAALRRVVAAGVPLDVIPGNHDVELHRLAVQRRFTVLGAGRGQVTFHPWIYFVPGVLYAEHGHQHHDINSLVTLLDPDDPRRPGQLEVPIASRRAPRGGGIRARAAFALEATHHAWMLAVPSTARRRHAYRATRLREHAPSVGLDHATLVQLDRLSETTAPAIIRRLVRRVVSGAGPADYLHRAAGAIDEVLRTAGASVPFYVFGHTHVAERVALPTNENAAYLNSGTWSPCAPHPTFVTVVHGGDHSPTAEVLRRDSSTLASAPATGSPPAGLDRTGPGGAVTSRGAQPV
jgi:UDP-2,3-diacylglucosamine pyrophosphatase LpxH